MDVGREVRQVVAKALKVPVERLTDDTRLEDLGAESLDVIEVMFELEEKFDVSISLSPDAESPTFATIGDVSKAVQTLLDGKAQR